YRKFNSSDLLGRMVGSVESLQNIYLRVYYTPVVIGLTALIAMMVTFYFSYVHAIIIFLSMLITLVLIPCLCSNKAQTLKKRVNHIQGQLLNQFIDYIQQYEE